MDVLESGLRDADGDAAVIGACEDAGDVGAGLSLKYEVKDHSILRRERVYRSDISLSAPSSRGVTDCDPLHPNLFARKAAPGHTLAPTVHYGQ